jgi:hypothetical protein
MDGKVLLLVAVLIVIVAIVAIALNQAPITELFNMGRTGGPCSYHTYVGRCVVASIQPATVSDNAGYAVNGIGYQGFEVNYTFVPANQSGLPDWVNYTNWTQSLFTSTIRIVLINNDTIEGYYPPGPLYLKKYNITLNTSFDCNASLITQGSCYPLAGRGFEFTYFNETDDFEILAATNASG